MGYDLPMPYRSLDPEKIIKTAERLQSRISERFPESGLSKVASELVTLAKTNAEQAEALAKPLLLLRWTVGIVTFLGALVFVFIGTFFSFDRIGQNGYDFVQGLEATINTLVLAGLGYITLFKSEERIKRQRVLRGLHSLRSIIHVIDMHQLTKDPVVFNRDIKPTPSSPQREMSPAELSRYLDYCSEMLALTGKIAALYAQSVQDTEVSDAVNDVEMLGSNLSRKIWQKIVAIGADALPRKNRSA